MKKKTDKQQLHIPYTSMNEPEMQNENVRR